MKKIRILLTGGGTGGHIYPLLAVAEELKSVATENQLAVDVQYYGAPGDYKNLIEMAGIKTSSIVSSKLRRYFSLANFIDFPKFIFGLVQAIFKLYFFMPDVVFSKGGPGALPVVLGAKFYNIPIIIHESDSVPSLTSTISGKVATRIGVAFESTIGYFNKPEIVAVVGNPIRRDFFENRKSEAEAKQDLKLNSEKPLILIIGGSQGAVTVNDFILSNLAVLVKSFQVLHQTGFNNYKNVISEAKFILEGLSAEEQGNYRAMPYLDKEMKDAMTAADLIISRSGAGAIFEIATFGKPSILIPLKDSAQDHQKKNAYEFSKTGAAVIMEEGNLLPNVFLAQIKKLFENPDLLRQMREAATQFAKPNSGRMIAEEILKIAIKY